MRTNFLSILALLAAVVAGCGEASSDAPDVRADESPPVAASIEPLAAGSPLSAGEASIEILKVVLADEIGGVEAVRASDGGRFVLVEYRVRNQGAEQFRFDEAPAPELVGPDGQVLVADPQLTARLRNGSLSYANPPTLVSPGVGVKTAVAFEVSAQAFDRRSWLIGLDRGPRARLPGPPIQLKPPAPASEPEADEVAIEQLQDDAAASGLTTAGPVPTE